MGIGYPTKAQMLSRRQTTARRASVHHPDTFEIAKRSGTPDMVADLSGVPTTFARGNDCPQSPHEQRITALRGFVQQAVWNWSPDATYGPSSTCTTTTVWTFD